MRRLLLLATAAAALATAAPAGAETCHALTGRIGVCYDTTCADPGGCYVDPYCHQIKPPTPGCWEIDGLFITPTPR
jgi:hypothetical protein